MSDYTYYISGTGFENYSTCSYWKAMCFANDMLFGFHADVTIIKKHNITHYETNITGEI